MDQYPWDTTVLGEPSWYLKNTIFILEKEDREALNPLPYTAAEVEAAVANQEPY
jgi:hypothetical protein